MQAIQKRDVKIIRLMKRRLRNTFIGASVRAGSRPCLVLLALASLLSFVGCTAGSGGGTLASLNPPPGTPATVPVSTISSVAPSNANAGGAEFTITGTGE